jgi:hypothetical protein
LYVFQLSDLASVFFFFARASFLLFSRNELGLIAIQEIIGRCLAIASAFNEASEERVKAIVLTEIYSRSVSSLTNTESLTE